MHNYRSILAFLFFTSYTWLSLASQKYNIYNTHSGKVLGKCNHGKDCIAQQSDSFSGSGTWLFSETSETGYFTIQSGQSNLFLSTRLGEQSLFLDPLDHAKSGQKWKFEHAQGNLVYIHCQTGGYLSLERQELHDGLPVILKEKDGTAAQIWHVCESARKETFNINYYVSNLHLPALGPLSRVESILKHHNDLELESPFLRRVEDTAG